MTTPQLHDYLEKQAAGYLDGLGRDALSVTAPDALQRMQSNARGLSGTARLAGEDRVQRAAAAIQRALRSASDGNIPEDLAERLSRSVDELRTLLKADGPEEALNGRAAGIVARWTEPGEAGSVDTEPAGETFEVFVEREADAIADTMDQGLSVFSENPSSREWLGAILRRQRALLGSVRLDEVTIVAEALKAVEDLSELIVRLDIPVKSEWLDVFRSARDVLRSASESLRQGAEPSQTPALSRLRTLREELVARYGDREPARPAPVESRHGADVIEVVEDPEEEARQRAAVLKVRVATALADEPEARRALDDLYAMLLSALR